MHLSPSVEHRAQKFFLKSFSMVASETQSIIVPCLFGSFDHVKPKCMWEVAEAVIGRFPSGFISGQVFGSSPFSETN